MPSIDTADTLMVCVLRSPPFRGIALERMGRLKPFDPLLYPAHRILWDTIERLHPLIPKDKPISQFHVEAELKEKFGDDQQDVVNTIKALFLMAEAIAPEEIEESVAVAYLDEFRVLAIKKEVNSRLTEVYTHEDLMAMINKSCKDYATVDASDNLIIEQPLLDPLRYMPTSIKLPTGIRWMDHLSYGGHSRGELVGLLAPTGGGKTLTATSLLIAQAKRKQHALLLTYEQPIAGDLTERLYCRMFDDRPIDFFRNTSPKDWCAEDKARYNELKTIMANYVHVTDFTRGSNGANGVMDVEDSINALIKANMGPTYVLVDWLWPMVTRYCVLRNIDLKQARLVAGSFMDELGQLAKRTTAIILVFHQLGTAAARANPSSIPVVTEAMEVRNFAFMTDLCYVVGNRDLESHVMWTGTDKNRRGAPQHILSRMDGARGVIEPANDMVSDLRGRFVSKDKLVSEEEDTHDDGGDPFR